MGSDVDNVSTLASVFAPTDHLRSSPVACVHKIQRLELFRNLVTEKEIKSEIETYHAEEGAEGISRSAVLDRMSLFSLSMPSSVTESRVLS